MLENIEIGAMGWDCASGFYPEDLPEDWRLEYYANEFSAMLVPQRVWRRWGTAEEVETFAEQAETLRWCGLGVRTPLTDNEAALAQSLIAALEANNVQTGILSHVALPAALEACTAVTWLDRPDVPASWRWRNLSGAPLGWVTSLPADAMAQRRLLEAFNATLPEEMTGAPFIVRDGCDNIERLKAFRQLAELMGL